MDSQAPNTEERVELAEGDQSSLCETAERDKTKSLFERLWLASNSIGAIEKDGQVNGGRNYKYVSHDNVTARAKEAFHRHGVYHFATIVDMKQDGNRTVAKVNLHFINVDNPEETLVTQAIGYGNDNQDKGPGKAYSYAVKYGLSKLLMLNTDENIEAHDVPFDDGQSAKVAEAKEVTRETQEAWANALRAAIKGARSLEELAALEKEHKARLSSPDLPSVTRAFFIDLIQERKTELSK